jgi:EpsI family protein
VNIGEHNRRQVIAASVVASLLMGLFGLIYRVVAAPVSHAPLDPNALGQFPLQIGAWGGENIPISPDIKDAIDADSYVNRRYSRRNGAESISLYFPCGTNASKLLQHVPENCYVGAGWTLVDRRPVELSLGEERKLPCSIVQFARGGLDLRRLVLLHFLIVDGECFTTFSAVAKAKGWWHFAGVNYAAQVQIVASADNMAVDAATEMVTDFARDAGPVMEQFFEDLKNARTAQESRGSFGK